MNISHNDIIVFLKNNGVKVASLMSEVDEENYKKILSEFSKEKLQIDRFRKEQARQAIVDTRRKTDDNKTVEKKDVVVEELAMFFVAAFAALKVPKVEPKIIVKIEK